MNPTLKHIAMQHLDAYKSAIDECNNMIAKSQLAIKALAEKRDEIQVAITELTNAINDE